MNINIILIGDIHMYNLNQRDLGSDHVGISRNEEPNQSCYSEY